ncbi:CXXX repeat peptide modification system protein [Clostridium tyrobutyricum]|uniref:CXXX repeat peptide modification system protein n=1 Tax=Clostridium tyrobutyricum TaxID=1519 RepID=UPI001C3CF070|nr:CXXX repeat peptide modification system protein [Clostridium tyrobutyricum]MBV4438641.1 CXXX repeat peptide modification system protein [Clostridium tyrobutyricum]
MSKKILATITEYERDTIEQLYEKISSLKSLIISLSEKKLKSDEQNFFYKKILNDWYTTNKKYTYWWQKIYKKYNFSKENIGKLYIDFENMEIYPMN